MPITNDKEIIMTLSTLIKNILLTSVLAYAVNSYSAGIDFGTTGTKLSSDCAATKTYNYISCDGVAYPTDSCSKAQLTTNSYGFKPDHKRYQALLAMGWNFKGSVGSDKECAEITAAIEQARNDKRISQLRKKGF